MRLSSGLGAFASEAGCRALVAAGQHLARLPGKARFVSWNLHWFPDGTPGQRGAGADVGWVACALAWLDPDVVALQEIKQTPRAQRALSALLGELGRLSRSRGRYVVRLDDCGSRVPQHVALAWNSARVSAAEVETIAALNPHGAACEGELRPGLGARLRFPGGLDLEVVSAHFKSRDDERALELRRRSFSAIAGVEQKVAARDQDADFLLLGDLNTMGCRKCGVTAQAEIAGAARLLGQAGLWLVPADARGSELHQGGMTLLDHAVASAALRELPAGARSHLAGACESGAGRLSRRQQQGLTRALSDHCPLVLDLTDRDLD